MLLSFFLIFYQLQSGVLSGISLIHDQFIHNSATREYILMVLFLMPVNWILETVKWKFLTQIFYRQSFLRALRGVLSGIAVSFFTPNRSGEFAGRILHLPAQHRLNGAVYSVAGSLAQLLITVTAGVVSLLFIYEQLFPGQEAVRWIIYISLIVSVIAFHVLFFRLPVFGDYLSSLKVNVKWLDKINSVKHIDTMLLVKIYTLSLLRYAVFTMQFFLLLQAFGNMYSGWLPLLLIMISFLFISLIPSFALGEIGVRGSICIFLFTAMGFNGHEVLIASTGLWVVNIVVPAAAGAVSMLYFKLDS